MFIISQFLRWTQTRLFPHLEDQLGPLTEKEKELARLLEFIHIEDGVEELPKGFRGQQPHSRKPIARAFLAKSFLGIGQTSELLERLRSSPNLRRLCGWECLEELPSASTFSRAFAGFANSRLPQKTHESVVRNAYADELAMHVSRDSTAINAREKAERKAPKPELPKRKRGRPKKGEEPPPKPPTVLEMQQSQGLEEMLSALPASCNWGCKKNSKGRKEYWKGYKLHLDVADGGVIVNALLTSASVHDSQAAIPLSLGSSLRLHVLYELMDAAYDAKEIRLYSNFLGNTPLIDHNPRGKEKREMCPAEKLRYHQRSTVERVNGRLKDEFGARSVWVRGPTKVMAHLMFGVLALTADALFRLSS